MHFRLHVDLSGQSDRFDEPASYAFDEHGHLVIRTAEGTRRTYSHHGWSYVEEFQDDEESPRRQAAPPSAPTP